MKKRGWIFALIFILLVVTALWLRIRNNKDTLQPEVSVANVSIRNIDNDNMDVVAFVRIQNPLPVALKADSIEYDLFLNETKLVSDAYGKRVEIPAEQETTIQLPLKLSVPGVVRELKQIKDLKADSALYTMAGSFQMNVPVAGDRKFSFKKSKWLPSFQVPEVKLTDVDLKKASFKESSMRATLSVYNPNSYRLHMADVGIQLLVGDAINLVGAIDGMTTIGAGQTQQVPVQLRFKDQNIVKAAWAALFKKESTPTSMKVTSTLISKSTLIDSTKLNVQTKGTLKEWMSAYRKVKEEVKKN